MTPPSPRPAGYAGRCYPCRPRTSITGAIAVTGIWWLVAHSSGQGWVQALGDVVFAGLVVGVLGPWLALRRIRVAVVEAPSDAVAGSPLNLRYISRRPVRLTGLSLTGGSLDHERLVVVLAGHCVIRSVLVEMATAAPFGLQWWGRQVELELPHPVYVAPRRGPAPAVAAAAGADRATGDRTRPAAAGELRSTRPYRAGDGRNTVHWKATAHSGELMVRDMDGPMGPPVEVEVALPAGPAAEEVAERALGEVLAYVEAGRAVLLTTREASGPKRAIVTDRRTAARRLAAAVSGP